ncbi:Gfo/Idh/MocA family oxidoreductase [Dyadobacter sp. LHD-138]|uniref:Gfo/Idh/MocA family protein n=1 Tax=Dyadobacter sp. LHD-138 TaxID=3071413 RepID=UPI0027DEAFC9|nr:Gfo/Idh/MocA family oxidoreductase [Dyadobacter sp. LHD-138]MDQ6480050.1 Gfo/Idh/MocA family oxidoreductase [Dyadobacter sp. LHD-138]
MMEKHHNNQASDANSGNVPGKTSEKDSFNRRLFLQSIGLGSAALGLLQTGCSTDNKANDGSKGNQAIQGFEKDSSASQSLKKWVAISDKKVRVGIVGYGLCKFGAAFEFQNHPNVEIVAVSDLFPDRCAELAKACRCSKTYPSLEELVKDDSIEAVFIATDAPSHAKHAIEALKHGKHVAVAVPAVFGSLEDADRLYEAVKTSGKKYMMFETSCFHEDLYAMRQIYNKGGFGKLVYSEGEYYHYMDEPLASYKDWRVGLPPQYYPTHSNAYYVGVTGGSFTEVSCLGIPSIVKQLQPSNNRYKNPFGTEIALFRTSEGGMSRMAVSWDSPGDHGEKGRIRGQKGSFYGKYEGHENALPDLIRPALPPGVDEGGHGGSHGRLTDEFISSILLDRQPLVNIAMALNLTVSGIVAHQSALKDGELLKIPQYKI